MFFFHSNAHKVQVQDTEGLVEVAVEDLAEKVQDLEEEEDLVVRLSRATALQVRLPWAVVVLAGPATAS